MSRIEKKFEKIIRSPDNTDWRELETLIKYYGCQVKEGRSHKIVFHKIRNRPLTISVHGGKVKTVYVKEIIKLIEEIREEDNYD
ncbi:type II toxin-antitoxin system HicA family toxin [Virgibacillus sp. NKC19-16]|uniref:type II toxin-antitoxin system HicA family toxin n=1 Tax=Virgibacillus salidurans TaxID=2831673 RepID=UPI001F2C0807|nr:type II toxin-antitoxin system HicA family toxin [Virgibacillus sp. NKC19-16]UJL45613.1 type II toxin-antitoxin system HicA family toxin [Virgibacillus sp. NKC19-16]